MKYAKTNKVSSGKKAVKVTNLGGGVGYQKTPEVELACFLNTSFMEDSYYEKAGVKEDRLANLVDKVDPLFAAKAALFARREAHMRSSTHALAAHVVQRVKCQEWVKNFIAGVIERPDDAIEILAAWINKYSPAKESKKGKKIPNALKKGIALGLSKFDEYQIAKYKKSSSNLSLVDVVRLTHPKTVVGSPLYKLRAGTLATPETWETKMTQAGQEAKTEEQKQELKGNAWKDLVDSGKIGYMALLRNLRNIKDNCDEETLDKALNILTDPKRVARSKQFPYRFFTAYKQLNNDGTANNKINNALCDALDLSVKNIPELPGKTAVIIDLSGSMGSLMSNNSIIRCREVASLMGVALSKGGFDCDVIGFSRFAKHIPILKRDSIISGIEKVCGSMNGFETNMASAINALNEDYDRVFVFSDGAVNVSSAEQARKNYLKTHPNADPYFYNIDLRGYRSQPFVPNSKCVTIAGFSDKVYDLIQVNEQNPNVFVDRINEISLDDYMK